MTPSAFDRMVYDALYYTYPAWSVALALLSLPYELGRRVLNEALLKGRRA